MREEFYAIFQQNFHFSVSIIGDFTNEGQGLGCYLSGYRLFLSVVSPLLMLSIRCSTRVYNFIRVRLREN